MPHGPASGGRGGRRRPCVEPHVGSGTPDLHPHRLKPDGIGPTAFVPSIPATRPQRTYLVAVGGVAMSDAGNKLSPVDPSICTATCRRQLRCSSAGCRCGASWPIGIRAAGPGEMVVGLAGRLRCRACGQRGVQISISPDTRPSGQTMEGRGAGAGDAGRATYLTDWKGRRRCGRHTQRCRQLALSLISFRSRRGGTRFVDVAVRGKPSSSLQL